MLKSTSLGSLKGFLLPSIVLMVLMVSLLGEGRRLLAAENKSNLPNEGKLGTEEEFKSVPIAGYKIVNVYPHDPEAFTQGLVYEESCLYESTGLYGRSSIRQVELSTGKVIRSRLLPVFYFGEGLTVWGDHLIQLTWKSHRGFVYGRKSFEMLSTFGYQGEGWGITRVGSFLVMSDGSAILRFLNPTSLEEIKSLEVHDGTHPVKYLNELEYIKGEIFANVWRTDLIARISPETGKVVGWLDLAGLRSSLKSTGKEDVLNGIAYDAQNDRIFVTGKLWPKLFEIQLVPPPKS